MSEQEKLEELRGVIKDLPEYVPANEGGAYELEKTIVEFRKDDDSDYYIAELLCWHLRAEDHQAIRNELKEYGDVVILHEDADSFRLELRNIDRDIVQEPQFRHCHKRKLYRSKDELHMDDKNRWAGCKKCDLPVK